MYFPKGEITTKREKNKIKTEVFFLFLLSASAHCLLHASSPGQVHGLCTASTWPLYCEYMAFVLQVHGFCIAGDSPFRRRRPTAAMPAEREIRERVQAHGATARRYELDM